LIVSDVSRKQALVVAVMIWAAIIALVVCAMIVISGCKKSAPPERVTVRIPSPPAIADMPTVREKVVEMAVMPVAPPPAVREWYVPIYYPTNIDKMAYFWCVERCTNQWEWAFDQWCNPDSNGTQTVTQRARVEWIRIAGYDTANVRIQ